MSAARRRPALVFALLAAVPIFYALFVIRDFRGPIGDYSESFLSEYQAFYTAKHLTLWPLPHLHLVNDDILYPYGTNGALQSWCVERDVLGAALTHLFGRGPFLQFYYLAGVIVSALLVFFLLRRDHGDLRAACASALMHGFNFYGMQKYPYHFNMAVCHWAIAGIVCDFVIVERVVRGRHVSLRLLGLRMLLLALSFGLELGHVVGYSLTSALLSAAFLAGRAIVIRWRAGVGLAGVRTEIASALARRKAEARESWRSLAALGAALAAVTWLYGSIVAGIVLDTRAYDFGRVQLGVWWSHPLRLLIPYFPFLHPSQQPRFLRIRDDVAEVGIGSGGAGWLLLGLALLGMWQARRRIAPYVPILAALFLYIVSGPQLPLLRMLPWFAFMRVYSRATLVYSALFTLLAIEVSFAGSRGRRWIGALLLAVGALELSTIILIKRGDAAYAPQPAVLSYFERIKQQPGEALLDWPFCIVGGNGQIGELCPYWVKMRGVFALQRFHEKKVIGQYLGRLHPLQVKPFVDAGWPKLFDPDAADQTRADRQRRCLDDDEWALFTEFYRYNDFAGIQLALDRLPPGCAESFYARFGAPAGETTVAAAVRAVTIKPSPDRTDNRLDSVCRAYPGMAARPLCGAHS